VTAVWYRFRVELLTRWRAWFGRTLLVAIGAGFVMATLAAARRTDSAYDGFLVAQDADDVQIRSGGSLSDFADIDVDAVARLPEPAQAL
jgi:hypothetical protein